MEKNNRRKSRLGIGNRFAQMSRNILHKAGIGIDDAANGVFLPKNMQYPTPPASIHSTLHTNLYYKSIFERLSNVHINQVGNELKLIGDELLQGIFPF